MADTTITVNAGVCRFKTVIEPSMDEEMNVTSKIKSECPNVREFGKNIGSISLMDAIATPFCENCIYAKAGEYLPHVACSVPSAVIKAAEIVGDLCLKSDVTFKIE